MSICQLLVLPEREEMSMEEVSELLEDHSRRLHECETAQKQLQQQFSDLSHLVNTSLLSAFSQPSGPGSKNPVSSITLVPDELSGMASRQAKKESVPPKQWQDSLTSPLDDNALVPPLVTVSDLPPLAHRPVEEGSLEQWDDAQVERAGDLRLQESATVGPRAAAESFIETTAAVAVGREDKGVPLVRGRSAAIGGEKEE